MSIYLPSLRCVVLCFLLYTLTLILLKLCCRMKFRNYVPHDKNLQEGKLAPAVLPKFEDPVDAVPPPEPEAAEDPFLNIAPKKPNWDLRRDVQKKLDKLEKRTQKALYQLMGI